MSTGAGRRSLGAPLLAATFAAQLAGCATIEYYAQAIGGHLEIMRLARPIEERLAESDTPLALKARLERVREIRDFAGRELALPDNGSYRRYAEIGRPYAVWNVYAAPEFSVRASPSCFPVAGCVAYRGFYARADAERHARGLRERGFDVFLAGVPAYSTLGWFDDPVLSSFIGYPDAELARLVFHELAHQVAWARDDTEFNESFATAVEEEGVRRWLERHGSDAGREAQRTADARRAGFVALVEGTRARLAALYASALAPAPMREEKARILAQLSESYRAKKADWRGFSGYDRYFAGAPNNALIASVVSYTGLLPQLRALLARHRGDLRAFYSEARELARLDRAERAARLGVASR